jgi:ABC-type glycerol-3-phosphate transport system permease component
MRPSERILLYWEEPAAAQLLGSNAAPLESSDVSGASRAGGWTAITAFQVWGQLSAIGVLASWPVLLLVGVVHRALSRGFAGGLH